MYGKIFSSMYDGSLYGQWEAIVTFQQMIVLSDAEGYVDMTPQALAARTSIPLDIIAKGIELLSAPDKYSRTPDCDGRRIELVDAKRPWGWRIVNHSTYRKMASADEKREADRLRIAAKREAERVPEKGPRTSGAEMFHDEQLSQPVAACRELSREVANVAHAEAEAVSIKTPLPPKGGVGRFEEFWRAYPRKIHKAAAQRTWDRKKLNARSEEILEHLRKRTTTDADWLREDGKYIPHPATWLNAAGWLDEYPRIQTNGVNHDGPYI